MCQKTKSLLMYVAINLTLSFTTLAYFQAFHDATSGRLYRFREYWRMPREVSFTMSLK